ncbi:MAG TPA: hypothetical protein VHO84_09175 [Syntrophorhabdaceae bacterium]|nr:hypothetical protein [Syntrophorhabdaceae bacterium]HEX3007787.1 hypothetical protein [Bacteroidales bacterium]
MKRIEKFVLVLSIITAIKTCAVPAITSVLQHQVRHSPPQAFADAAGSITFVSFIGFVLANGACAVWLLFESRKEKLSSYIWSLFGLTFGLNGVIMFYLYMILSEIRLKWAKSDESAA